MPEEQKKGLLDGVINAVSSRDEVAALQAAKKEAEQARAQASQELAKRQEAEVRANKAESDLRAVRTQIDQEMNQKRSAEARATAAETRANAADGKVKALEAEIYRLKQEVETKAHTYVVKAGDSLSKIAKQLYGDAKRWTEIYEANKDKIKDPNLIHPGQELRIP